VITLHEPDSVIASVNVENGKVSAPRSSEKPHYENWPDLSPDGRWLAFGSDVSGRWEVYVRPYPGPGLAEPVSLEAAGSPAWNPNGRELFFVSPAEPAPEHRMMAVDFAAGSPVRIGRPRLLFRFDNRDLHLRCTPVRCYDVAQDGQRFYAVQSRTPLQPSPPVTHINVVLNWFEELKAKVPHE